ncbi:outer membrane protein with beta-barrel domain [Desulfobotulus alkaliphilus]|uniref:Outer membrane protein with beta-barrel domain n=1 Tax=Desulfobotulus alkaliphilus TaxID=622671 RepID=A0A562RXT9_9BACT|nr:OmpW family outer membrane protein [Desulfobotulus alkaliphilus]TWI73220.1 outer membrane protein with beta-barrel domain [Desulfobotulus alkaliphilus]
MNKTFKFLIFFAFITILPAEAGIFGKRYIGFSVGHTIVGDEELQNIDDPILSYGLGGRFPVSPNLDLMGSVTQSKISGDMYLYNQWGGYYSVSMKTTGTIISGSFQYHFLPEEKVNPFIGLGLAWSKVETETSFGGYTYSETDNDAGALLGAGAEISLDDTISLNFGILYQTEMYDKEDFILGGGFNLWATPQLLLTIAGQYSFEFENKSISAGISIGF